MALETPNQVHASALLLVEGFEDPPNSTIVFGTNNGFASVAFIDIDNPDIGIVLAMDQPVSNMEGSAYLGGDPDSGAKDSDAYITPRHYSVGEAIIDDLPANHVVIDSLEAEDVFRISVFVIGQTALAEAPAGEPV